MNHFVRLLGAAMVLMMLPALALAHAQFRGSDPAPNALVLERPEHVLIRFSEPVSPVAMRWISPAGDSFPVTAEPDGKQVRVAPPPDAGDGSYLLAWRVVSLDGHPVSGTLVISVGVPSEIPSLGNIEWPPASTWTLIVMKFALSVALTIGVGGTIYQVFVARGARQMSMATKTALILVFPAALLLVGAQGLDLLGLSPGALFSGDPWATGAGTSILRTALLSALAAMIALALRLKFLAAQGSIRPIIALIAWALAATSFAVSGHAATAEPEWQAVSASILHGMAMMFWLGAFLPLLGLLRTPAEALPELKRFATMATPLVLVLLVSGFFMASIHAGSGGFRALAMSGYGVLLFVKLVSVIGLLFIAAHNRLVLTPALRAGTPGADKALGGSIRAEIILALLIIAFASSFRLTPPPQTQTEEPQPQIVAFTEKEIAAEIRLNPALVGPNVVELSLGNADGTPLEPIEVEFAFSIPDKGIGPIVITAERREDQSWSTQPVILPLAGEWQVSIELLVTDFDVETLTTRVNIGP